MRERVLAGIATITLGLALLPLPARAQCSTFRFVPPASTRAQNGAYTVRWSDEADIYEGLASITWYYATRPDGADRKRMVIRGREDFTREDFSRFRRNWRCTGPLADEWKVKEDRHGRVEFLSAPADAGPAISRMPTERDIVASFLVRPQGPRNEFALGLRVQETGEGYRIRNDGDTIQIVRGDRVLAARRRTGVSPLNWYWYEVGVRSVQTKAGQTRAVEIRVQVYDAERQRLQVRFSAADRPEQETLLKSGYLSLWGPADFAEVYVDPWTARWEDDSQNTVHWDTTRVPDGDYFVVAELADEKGRPRIEVSKFRVEVRGSKRADAE